MNAFSARGPRRARLAVGIASSLAIALSIGDHALAVPIPDATHSRTDGYVGHISTRHLSPMSHTVTSCADDGSPGTLRSVIADPTTMSGDTVDLSMLVCSRITLGSELRIHQDDLTLLGPDPTVNMTIDGHHHVENIQHFGYGTLEIHQISVAYGYFASATDPTGGCIWSRGSVSLIDAQVTHCHAQTLSAAAEVRGGGVYTRDDLSLARSSISYCHAYSNVGGDPRGGGAYVGGIFTSDESTLANNAARTLAGGFGRGGGVFVHAGATVSATTITRNRADRVAGLMLYNPFATGTASIVDSTISGNAALQDIGGVYSAIPLKVANSTIAFNQSNGPSGWADGLYVSAALELNSSLIADNVGKAGLSDIGSAPGAAITGSNNLVVHANSGATLPANTLSDCPRLDPLVDTGGPTSTHGLRVGSPAIDAGDGGVLTTDQRGLPRVVGATADIGSVERQNGDVDERILSHSFEGPCDI
jgi:hypothetical protein